MQISHIKTIEQIKNFLNSTMGYTLSAQSKKEVYEWLNWLLCQIHYHKLKKPKKRLIKEYIQKVTNYSNVQIKRLISKHKKGELYWKKWQKKERFYTSEDIMLLHQVDQEHRLSGAAIRKILKRGYKVFNNEKFERLANISVSHIYNLRARVEYQRLGKIFDKTKPTVSNIGKRMKPIPNGKPGYFRVDTVHQGDKGNQKGVYYINIVDEVTQWEFVFCVPTICERYIIPVLKALLSARPYKIINFHSDNGSEYINYKLAGILNRLHIKQTKSRPRKHNDNALVEGKNGAIIRKHFGYAHIPATEHNAYILNQFCVNWLNIYLNYHRPCGFATVQYDKKGKEKKVYKHENYDPPYEKLKSLPDGFQHLKASNSFKLLDKIAYNKDDTTFAKEMNIMKIKMFKNLKY